MAWLLTSHPVQGAIDWLDKNADRTVEELKEEQADEDAGMPQIQPGEDARSLLCKDCGKKFRTQAQAEFHASKTYITWGPYCVSLLTDL